MDAIQAARELGKAIQADERYIAIAKASQKTQADQGLQDMIASFNKTRADLNAELQKEEKDTIQIRELDSQLKSQYQTILTNENMKELNDVKGDFEQMIAFINQIVSGSAQGQDPDTIQFQESCSGSCGSCSGCN